MTYTLFPGFSLKKLVMAATVSLMLVSGQVQALNRCTVYGVLTLASVFVISTTLYELQPWYYGIFESDKTKNSLPKITYEVDKVEKMLSSGERIVLIPEIKRGEVVKIYNTETLGNFTKRAICDPLGTVKMGVDPQNIQIKCHDWFASNKNMFFPHQFVGYTIDQLDSLLLPKIEYDVETHKFEFKGVVVSFTDKDGKPSTVVTEATELKKAAWQPLIPDIKGYDSRTNTRKHPYKLCHHAPEYAGMTPPKFDVKRRSYYSFAVPGISHFHRDDDEHYIAIKKVRGDFIGAVWRINKPWPVGYQEYIFKPAELKKALRVLL